MHTSTLRGVFPEPKPVHRRNFIKENVKSIKQMQGLLQEAGVIQPRHVKDDKYKSVPPLPRLNRSRDSTPHNFRGSSDEVCKQIPTKSVNQRLNNKKVEPTDQKFTHRSVQTERTDDLSKLYETGVIKYPSVAAVAKKSTRNYPQKAHDQGDVIDDITDDVQNLDLDDKDFDFIKGNKQNIKTKTAKPQNTPKVPVKPPPTYQRGVVPKYLRDRKEEEAKDEIEPDCPLGHILLPEEERKETLRVLRQSYADRIQELNMMPVRNDTLKMRKRKMDIEEELKRIDGGIKVFQRPKVFVKINA